MDAELFHYLNHALASPEMDKAMMFVSGKWPWIVAALVLVGYALVRRSRRLLSVCLQLGLTIGLADFTSYQVLKPAFARERPCHQLKDVRLVPENCGGDFGFPSNHAANGMGTAVIFALTMSRPVAAFVFAMALLVGFSRIYLGVHFPGDVLGGFVVGATLALLCHGLYRLGARRLAGRRQAAAGG